MKARLYTRRMIWGDWVQQKAELNFVPGIGEHLCLPDSEDWFEVCAVLRHTADSAEVAAEVYAILVDKMMVLKGM